MRRLVAVFVVAAIALTLAGCGGGEEEAGNTTTPQPASTPPPPPASNEEAVLDRTPLVEVKFEPFPDGKASHESTSLPEAITQRLESDQPMLLFFFDAKQKTADDQRAEIDELLKQYRGTVDLIAYDIGQKTDDGKHDATDREAIALARALEVGFTPYIVLVDEQGLITWRYRGFVDRGVIERELLRATD